MDGPAPRFRVRYRSYIVIPARLASTRLPRKLLLSETGKPLIQHTYESALRATPSDRRLRGGRPRRDRGRAYAISAARS